MNASFFLTYLGLPMIALVLVLGAASVFSTAGTTAEAADEAPIVVATISFDNRN